MTLYCDNLAKPKINLPEFSSLYGSEFSFAAREICMRPDVQKWITAIFIHWRSVQDQALLQFMHIVADLLAHLLGEGQQPHLWFPQLQPDCSFCICKSQARNSERGLFILQATHLTKVETTKGRLRFQFVLMGSGLSLQIPFSLKNSIQFVLLCLLWSCFLYFMSIFSSWLSSLIQ